MKLEKAKSDDIDSIKQLIKEFAEESLNEYKMSFDDNTLIDTIKQFIDNQIIFVAVKLKEIVGVIAGVIHPSIFDNKQLIAQETIWFVSKDERKGTVGWRLLDEFEKSCG